ncbi:MAG: TonB-dependent receptor [Ferruginibacter sp.]
MRKYIFTSLTMLAAATATAQNPADTSLREKELTEVIVTGQYKPQSVKNSVYQVKVITRERIEKQAATRLQDVLATEMNFRFNQDLATGSSNITMMGLAGQNVKILLDGMPLIGRQGTNNEININQIDINTIERIEIVEGPMSVMYGADALGGVINIITKKGSQAKWSVTAKLHEETVGKEYSLFEKGIHNPSLAATYRYKNWSFGATGSYNYFGGWKGNAKGRDLQWHKKDQILASGFAQYATPRFSILYRIDGLDEIITNPDSLAVFQQSSGDSLYFDYEYLSQRVMQQLQAAYKVNNNLSFQAQSSYSDYSRQVYATTLSALTGAVRLNKAPGANSIVDFTGFTFRGSALYRLNKMFSFQPGVDINLDMGEGERMTAGQNKVNDYAFFITSEITPNDRINIKPGLRFMKNSVYDAPAVVPALNTKFKLGKQFDLRLSYANGFRSPSLRELYFNFFDANHQIIGNPNLKAETSNSFNGSLSWSKISAGRVAYATSLSGFFNKVKNLIDYAPSAADPNIFQLTNVSNSTTAGMGLQSTAKYKHWYFGVGVNYTGFYNSYSEDDKSLPELQWSAEANANLSYSITKAGLDLNLFYKFTGKRPRYVINTDGDYVKSIYDAYHWADFTLNKKIGKNLTINAGVRNLLDVDGVKASVATTGGAHSSGTQQYIATGRSYFGGLTFHFNQADKK